MFQWQLRYAKRMSYGEAGEASFTPEPSVPEAPESSMGETGSPVESSVFEGGGPADSTAEASGFEQGPMEFENEAPAWFEDAGEVPAEAGESPVAEIADQNPEGEAKAWFGDVGELPLETQEPAPLVAGQNMEGEASAWFEDAVEPPKEAVPEAPVGPTPHPNEILIPGDLYDKALPVPTEAATGPVAPAVLNEKPLESEPATLQEAIKPAGEQAPLIAEKTISTVAISEAAQRALKDGTAESQGLVETVPQDVVKTIRTDTAEHMNADLATNQERIEAAEAIAARNTAANLQDRLPIGREETGGSQQNLNEVLIAGDLYDKPPETMGIETGSSPASTTAPKEPGPDIGNETSANREMQPRETADPATADEPGGRPKWKEVAMALQVVASLQNPESLPTQPIPTEVRAEHGNYGSENYGEELKYSLQEAAKEVTKDAEEGARRDEESESLQRAYQAEKDTPTLVVDDPSKYPR